MKKKRPLKVYHDAVGFFVLRKNRRVPITNIDPKVISKNKLQSQVIVNNILSRPRPKKEGSAGLNTRQAPKPKVSDSDNFIRHSLVNQLEQLRHLQRNPQQHVPQPITVNNNIPVNPPANINVHPANVNVHPATVTVNNNMENHDPQQEFDDGSFKTPVKNSGKHETPISSSKVMEASNVLKKLFKTRENLDTLLNRADVRGGQNMEMDYVRIIQRYPELSQFLTTTSHRSDQQKRVLIETVLNYIDEKKSGRGKSDTIRSGIYDTEINHIMGKYAPVFQGTIMKDQVSQLKPARKMAFVMNTDTSDKPGKHWVACYLDADHDKSLEYYDSFGKDPPKNFDRDMKKIVDKLKLPHLLKYKINRIVEQKTSDNCGFHAMRFLTNRIKGNKFTEATKYNVLDAEKKAETMKHKFGFI